MPVTKDQAHMLAAIAVACRPHGATHWDAPGVVAAIGRVSNLHLPDVAKAVIRCAEDPTAKTPAPISNPSATCWRERTQAVAPRNVEARHRCGICGQREDHAMHAGDHPFERLGTTRGDTSAGVKLARSQMEDR
jgi:hypothetical protein